MFGRWNLLGQDGIWTSFLACLVQSRRGKGMDILHRYRDSASHLFQGLFGTKIFRRKNEENENGGKEDEETVWNEGNERTLFSGSL